MNEPTTDTNNTVDRDEEQRLREVPRREGDEEAQTSSSTDGKMSTADLAYGRNKDANDGALKSQAGRVEQVSLIQEEDAGGFRERWTSIQTHFIDEPRETVSEADELVAEVIQSLASRFAEARQSLEEQWQSGSDVSTEDLRVAMQQYRSFFERLLAA